MVSDLCLSLFITRLWLFFDIKLVPNFMSDSNLDQFLTGEGHLEFGMVSDLCLTLFTAGLRLFFNIKLTSNWPYIWGVACVSMSLRLVYGFFETLNQFHT